MKYTPNFSRSIVRRTTSPTLILTARPDFGILLAVQLPVSSAEKPMPGPSASPSEVPISDADRRQTMKTSIREGQAWAVMTGAGEAYIVPFAVALSATNAQVGMLSSLAGLLGAVSGAVSSGFDTAGATVIVTIAMDDAPLLSVTVTAKVYV